MPFNGSGTYNKPSNTFSPAASATTISSTDWNTTHTDLATALSNCICKDGQTTVTDNLPMATKRHTGVGDAQALTDYASANQVIDGALTYLGASAAGTDTYAVTAAISPGTLVTGARYIFKADVANTGACTLNVSGIGATSIKLLDGNDPYDSQIAANQFVEVVYDGTNFVLLNPQNAIIRGTYTSGTLTAGNASSTTVTHGLGTDDLDYYCISFGSLAITGGAISAIGAMIGPDKRHYWSGGPNQTNPGIVSVPSSGDVDVYAVNNAASSQTVTVHYTITRRYT